MLTLVLYLSLLVGLLIAGAALYQDAQVGQVSLGSLFFWSTFAVTWPIIVALVLVAALLALIVQELAGQ